MITDDSLGVVWSDLVYCSMNAVMASYLNVCHNERVWRVWGLEVKQKRE